MVTPGYDPLRQAISELFSIGAPALPRALVSSGLVVSGFALLGFAAALQRGLPGTGIAGPALAAISGVMTLLVVAVPCTHGCPGAGTTTNDTFHVLAAGAGYLALVLAPLLVAVRVRADAPSLAHWSLLLGGVALLGLAVRNLGPDVVGGLQQRTFNTVADAWYVLAAVYLIRRRGAAARVASGSAEGAGGGGI
jgi:hypothetical membrane protein